MTNFFKTITDQLWKYVNQFIQLLPQIALAIVVLIITFFVARKIKTFSNHRFSKHAKDPLLASFVGEIIRIVIIVIGVAIVLGIVRLNDVASKIVAGAGITAFIIGFAFRDIGENLLAGVMMAFKRPFRIGDVVETNGINGKILSMNMRETVVKTFDGKDVHIPNGLIIKNPLFNYTTDAFNRLEFSIRIPQTANISKAINTVEKVLENTDGIVNDNPPSVEVDNVTDGQVTIVARFWVNDEKATKPSSAVKSEAIQRTLTALDEAGYFGRATKADSVTAFG